MASPHVNQKAGTKTVTFGAVMKGQMRIIDRLVFALDNMPTPI
jgi:hypothetical protein